MLLPFGMRTFFQAEYFLPDLNAMREIACAYPTRILAREAFSGLYLPQWSKLICANGQHKIEPAGKFNANPEANHMRLGVYCCI